MINDHSTHGDAVPSGAPFFVISCAVGFLIISACAAYFVLKFFL